MYMKEEAGKLAWAAGPTAMCVVAVLFYWTRMESQRSCAHNTVLIFWVRIQDMVRFLLWYVWFGAHSVYGSLLEPTVRFQPNTRGALRIAQCR